ncbi:MAG: tRNA (cytidine(34)-2'-O)-methyltransferase [Phycisphaerae bacterium]
MAIPLHNLKVVLVEPEIPQNTGNIGRLCAAAGAELHLVRPLGFFLSDKHFKRAGMDYLQHVRLTVHDDSAALLRAIGSDPVWLTSGIEGRSLWSGTFESNAWILFGKESAGLPADLLSRFSERTVKIPMSDGCRGLNVSTAAGIVLYEALRQVSAR